MRWVQIWLVVFWGLAPLTAVAEVYKCVSRYGIVNFSDQPCGADAQPVELPEAPKVGTQLDPGYDESLFYQFSEAAKQKREADRLAQEARRKTTAVPNCPSDPTLADTARFGRVTLCMTPEMVRSATSITVDYDVVQWMDAEGQWERWQFRTRREHWPYSVVFQNGRVVRVVEQFDPFDGYYVPPEARRLPNRLSR